MSVMCLLLVTVGLRAEQLADVPLWQESSTEEGFKAFCEAMLARKAAEQNCNLLTDGIGLQIIDFAIDDGYLTKTSTAEERMNYVMRTFRKSGLVDREGNYPRYLTPSQFMEIGQDKNRGWWLYVEDKTEALQQASVKLATTANYIAEKQRQLAENGNWDISVRPAENLLNIIEREAGDVESVAEAIAILREEIKAIKERTFTPEMNKALDVRFAKQMATLRGEFDKKLNDLFDDTNKKITEVSSKIVDLSSGQEMLRGQQEAFAEQFAETNQANSTQFEELGKADRELGKQLTELESSLAGLASNSGWKINLLFVLVGLCLIGIAWILWSQRSEKRKERSKLSLVSNSAHRSSVDYDPPESIPEEQLFDVRKAVGMR
ncbi:hypothetical protein H6787_01270 [Candidatus Nomurabacteria bacterium]|nr:hypothetical protein [Candidatus Nomurabacteria bacterium]